MTDWLIPVGADPAEGIERLERRDLADPDVPRPPFRSLIPGGSLLRVKGIARLPLSEAARSHEQFDQSVRDLVTA
ncbi:MAG: hypothetical protein ACREQY_24390, partial [Candidatus Binatia bacterium]